MHLEALERLEEMECDEPVARRIAHGADRTGGGRVSRYVHDAQRTAAQRVTHALGAIADDLYCLGGRGFQTRFDERHRIEL